MVAADLVVLADAELSGWDAELQARLDADLGAMWRDMAPGVDTDALRAALVDAVGGGKRVRPRLLADVHDGLGGRRREAVLGMATAIELLHTAFVIHDDLIDNDDLRRGRPSVPGRFRADTPNTAAVGKFAATATG